MIRMGLIGLAVLIFSSCGRPHAMGLPVGMNGATGALIDSPTSPGGGSTSDGIGGGGGGTTAGNPDLISVDAQSSNPALAALSFNFQPSVPLATDPNNPFGKTAATITLGSLDLVTGVLKLKIKGTGQTFTPANPARFPNPTFVLQGSRLAGPSVTITNAYGTFNSSNTISFTLQGTVQATQAQPDTAEASINFLPALQRLKEVKNLGTAFEILTPAQQIDQAIHYEDNAWYQPVN